METVLTQPTHSTFPDAKEKVRLRNIDIMKGFLILFVVFYHIVGLYTNTSGSTGSYNFFGAAMGSFFILSGYFYKDEPYFKSLWKRFKRLIIPTLIAMVIIFIACFIYESAAGFNPDFVAYLKTFGMRIIDPYTFKSQLQFMPDSNLFLFTAYGPLWFIFRLFVAEAIFFAIAKKATQNIWSVLLTTAICLCLVQAYESAFLVATNAVDNVLVPIYGPEAGNLPLQPYMLPLQLEICVAIVPLLCIGAYLKKVNFAAWMMNGWKKANYWIIFGVMALLWATFGVHLAKYMGDALFSGLFVSVDFGENWMVFAWFACQLPMAYILWFVCSWIAKIPYLRGLFEYFGRHTLYILAFHLTISMIFVGIVSRDYFIYIQSLFYEYYYTLEFTGWSLVTPQWLLVIAAFLSLLLGIGFQHIENRIKKCIKIASLKRQNNKEVKTA